MASTEEKLLTLLLSVEHLQHTAMEQQKAVADSLAVARETLRGYRDISDGVAKQVRDEVRNEVQKLDVAGLIGERISQDFQRLEESVANMKANADALNRDRGLTLSGTKTHVKQRFLPLTPLLMVSDVLWSPVLPA
ncbi:TPA: hypothetical protein ACUA9M_004858 [Escherichia coli]